MALIALVTVVAAALLAGGCGGGDASAGGSGWGSAKLTLVAYSTPREAYEEIIPAFQATPEGEGVEFEQSYASSGEQSRAVEAGLAADVVAFSLEPDITRLVDAGIVAEDWNQDDSATRSSSSSSAKGTPTTSRRGTTSCATASR
jgi:ABC-type sulfate transport system substrate-binding protein